MFVYSAHTTREKAETALQQYVAKGEVCEAERPRVECCRDRETGRWCVLFPDA